MKTWVRRSLIAAVALLGASGGAYYWLIVESHVPPDAAYAIDIAAVRRMVESGGGDKPAAVEVEEVALFQMPATAIVAGDGWKPRDVPVFAYRLLYPDSCLLIDTALDPRKPSSMLVSVATDAYSRVQAALSQCSLTVITHEHMDHIGGLTAHEDLASVLPRTRLTREQIAHPEYSVPAEFPAHALDGYEPLQYDVYQVLAPGVVVIKAPGHTPGSQMVYVQTAGGEEFLFIGDVAWYARNIDLVRERARLVTWLFLEEDRTAVFGQLAALNRLRETQPGIHIVPGHDGKVIDSLIDAGALRRRFELPVAHTGATASSGESR
jgi:glyoxylase-like metal-dependent hydrolase (beta-lactamase superfamily II)